MLKAELIRPRVEIHGDQVRPRALPVDYASLALAGALIALVQRQVGQRRGALEAALDEYEGDRLDYPVIRGLAAVLTARCTFGSAPPVAPAELRAALFRRGPVTERPDLFSPQTRTQAVAEVAAELGVTSEQAEAALFADLAEEQLLLDPGPLLTPAELITRYNLEVARGLLYWAREVRLEVSGGYKDLFKYVKLFKLMYGVERIKESTNQRIQESANQQKAGADGYRVTLYGPLSPFVKSTLRYGVQFARFFPALLLCPRWQLEADILLPPPPGGESRGPLRYCLDDRTDLRSHFPASGPFDSALEADFAAEFEAKYGGAERVWELAREDELIVAGDAVMIPDFSFMHRKDGRRALLEIVGYWHPHYLQRKLAKVREAGRRDLILLIYESANVAEGTFEAVAAGEVLHFVRKPVLKEVLAAVERCAVKP